MLGFALLLGAGGASGQAVSQTGNPEVDAKKIVRSASWNELHSKSPGRSFRFRQQKLGLKGSTVKEIVETKDGDVSRLIEKDGKPLPPEDELLACQLER